MKKNIYNDILFIYQQLTDSKIFKLKYKIYFIKKIKKCLQFQINCDRIKKLFIKQEMTKVKVCKCWQNPTNFLEEVKEHA